MSLQIMMGGDPSFLAEILGSLSREQAVPMELTCRTAEGRNKALNSYLTEQTAWQNSVERKAAELKSQCAAYEVLLRNEDPMVMTIKDKVISWKVEAECQLRGMTAGYAPATMQKAARLAEIIIGLNQKPELTKDDLSAVRTAIKAIELLKDGFEERVNGYVLQRKGETAEHQAGKLMEKMFQAQPAKSKEDDNCAFCITVMKDVAAYMKTSVGTKNYLSRATEVFKNCLSGFESRAAQLPVRNNVS